MNDDNTYCATCGGPRTRSRYTPDQPDDSALCAPCWMQEHRPGELLTPDDLDDGDLEWDDHLIGRLVDWHSQIAPLVKCDDGALRLEVELTCAKCPATATLYAGSGLHSGAWPYIYSSAGSYLGCIRDQEYVCEAHGELDGDARRAGEDTTNGR